MEQTATREARELRDAIDAQAGELWFDGYSASSARDILLDHNSAATVELVEAIISDVYQPTA